MYTQAFRIRIVAVVLCLFAFAFIANTLTPFLVDDYSLTLVRGQGLGAAASAGCASAALLYQTIFDCLWASWLFGFLMNFDKAFYNVTNSLVFVSVSLLLLLHAPRRQGEGAGAYLENALLALLVFLLTIPVPSQTLLWMAGSVGYLWALACAAVFLRCYHRYDAVSGLAGRWRVMRWTAVVVFGLLAGNSHGATGGVCVLGSLLYMGYWRGVLKARIPLWAVAGCAVACCGVLAMVTAPGNHRRLDMIEMDALHNALYQVYAFWKTHGSIAALLLALFWFCWRQVRDWRDPRLIHMAIHLSIAFAGMASLTCVPAALRATLFFPYFMSAALVYGLQCIAATESVRLWKRVIIGVLLVTLLPHYVGLCSDALRIRNVVRQRERSIARQISDGKREIRVPHMTYWLIYQRFTHGLLDLTPDPDHWSNKGMASYYAVDRITGFDYNDSESHE